ncbi:hypothetical protein GU334_05105 [Lactococcus raffinolactis]|jgi:hypothetical protein|uniref:Uncharacterized protein n=1 Tax=Pseudolactococcus raffinolactis TaxID=1366 RepID=A0AAE6YLN4_9LACT|nr:hypothetical protein [Lactococcus raffinolactis]QIW58316.1 hypothetical protein GU334_05105 [Lactococcus raffinolactis]
MKKDNQIYSLLLVSVILLLMAVSSIWVQQTEINKMQHEQVIIKQCIDNATKALQTKDAELEGYLMQSLMKRGVE